MAAAIFFSVTGNVLALIGDQYVGDPDINPDFVGVQGQVTFTPGVNQKTPLLGTDLSPTPALLAPRPIVAEFSETGQLIYNGVPGVRLPANGSYLGLSGAYTYTVSFSNLYVGGVKIENFQPFTFTAPTSDVTIDLVEVARVPASTGIGMSRGPRGYTSWVVPVPDTDPQLYQITDPGGPVGSPFLIEDIIPEVVAANAVIAAAPDAIAAYLTLLGITFTDEGGGQGHFNFDDIPISGTLVPPAATWSGVAGRPESYAASEGVDATGATDARASIVALLAANAGTRTIRFGPGRYKIGSAYPDPIEIAVPSGTHITCDEGAVFEVNSDYGGRLFYAAGSDGTKTNMDADITAGANTVTLPAGAAAGFSVGDIIGFESTGTAIVRGANTTWVRELRRVEYVDGDDVVLDAPLEYSYLTSDTSQYWKVTPAENIVLEGLRFETGAGLDQNAVDNIVYAIRFYKTSNCRLENIQVHDMVGSVDLWDAYDTHIDGLTINKLPRQDASIGAVGGGYGLILRGGTTNLIVDGLLSRDCRHAVTTLADQRGSEFWGGPMFVQINGAIGMGGSNGGTAVFDTHEQGRHITFNNCLAIGGDPSRNPSGTGAQQAGFQIRNEHTTLNNCKAIYCGRQGVNTADSSKWVNINGGEFAYNTLVGLALDGQYHRVSDAYIYNNSGYGVQFTEATSSDHTVQGCTFRENNNYAISVASPPERVTIMGCHLIKGAIQLYGISCNNTTLTIKDNRHEGWGSSLATGNTGGGMFSIAAGCKYSGILADGYELSNVPKAIGLAPVITSTREINIRTNTTYTLALTDIGKVVTSGSASPTTWTVPLNATVAFPVGTFIDLRQLGAGQVTVAAAGGVTINATPGLKISAQYGGAQLVKVGTDTWVLTGDLAA